MANYCLTLILEEKNEANIRRKLPGLEGNISFRVGIENSGKGTSCAYPMLTRDLWKNNEGVCILVCMSTKIAKSGSFLEDIREPFPHTSILFGGE